MEFPDKIWITEVGPRDGFQSLTDWIDTPIKVEIVRRLFQAGVSRMEVASFISPKAIPQMRDGEDVVAGQEPENLEKSVGLVGNEKGAQRAWDCGLRSLTFVISASKAHNLSNVRKTPEQSLQELAHIRELFPQMRIKLSLATAFGCPFQGEIKDQEIRYVINGAIACGVREVCLCDTIGSAVPSQIRHVADLIRSDYEGQAVLWSLHLHNTRGLAAANTVVAMENGIRRFETAIAGLGGCPFAPGASGNMATEDLVYMAQRMGIETGIDLSKLLEITEFIHGTLGCRVDGRINMSTVNLVQCGERGLEA